MNKILDLFIENRFFYLFFFIAIFGAIYFDNHLHDYSAYVKEWNKIFQGQNPHNAYGVFFHFFCLPNELYNKLPKIIFIVVYFIAVKNIVEFSKGNKIVNTILLFNPLFWIFGVMYGSNDVFVSAITLLAIINLNNSKFSGFLFSIGSNFKYTPLSILPFLVVKNKEIKTQMIGVFLLFTTIFISIGYYFWGIDLMQGFMFNLNRDSSIFSVFRFISGTYEPLAFLNIYSLDFLSVYLVLLAWSICFICFICFNIDRYLMILLSYSNILLLYKSGHHQFYILLLMLSLLIYIIHKKSILKNKALILSFILFWCWIFLCTILYPLTSQYAEYYNIREWIGFPTFLFHLFLTFQLIIHIIRESRNNYLLIKRQ